MERQAQLSQSTLLLAAGPTTPATHFVYLVVCADHTLYTGYTTNVERRLAAHNAGTGAKYTRGRRPVVLVATWSFASKSEALRAERMIKSLSRAQKWHLAQEAESESYTPNPAPSIPPPPHSSFGLEEPITYD